MFYVKNVSTVERVLRVAAGLAVAVAGMLLAGGITGMLIAGAATGVVLTGLFGFCPMCALAGRRLDQARDGR